MIDGGQEAKMEVPDKEAVKSYRLAAEQGEAKAQCYLGFVYDNGLGVPQDYKEAVKWYRLAAEQGNADAQVNLGVMYYKGQGIPPPSRRWERHSLSQGSVNYKEAVKWYRLAAAQGNASAEYNLGVAYQEGCGVPQDQDEAIRLYQLAAAHGSKAAESALPHPIPPAVESALPHPIPPAVRPPQFRSPELKISGKRIAINATQIVASIMLFAALGSQPRGYYEVLRIIVCGVAAYSAYLAFPSHLRWTWFFGICAALFNPFLPVYLHDKSVWAVIDVAAGIAFLISVFVIKPAKQQ